jgi:hypothetical protein
MPIAEPGKPFTAGKAHIKYKGLYDWDGLYKLVWHYFASKDYEVQDTRYKSKKTTDGNEIKLDIRAERRQTAFIKLHGHVRIFAFDENEKLYDINGEKKLLTGGRLWCNVTTSVEYDWQGIFKGGNFFVRWMYEFYVWVNKKYLDNVIVDDHEYEAIRIASEIKKHLNMESSYNAFINSN